MSNTKKQVPKKQPVKKPTTKKTIDFKKKYEESKKEIIALQLKLIELKNENEKNVDDFHNKAKTFTAKAQTEVERIKKELNAKVDEEKLILKKYGSQKLIETILEPLTNMELAIKTSTNSPEVQAYVKGFEMLLDMTFGELARFGVIKIIPVKGDEFNPDIHHAIETIKGTPNKIIEVKKIGFKLYDRVIKPSSVIVGK